MSKLKKDGLGWGVACCKRHCGCYTVRPALGITAKADKRCAKDDMGATLSYEISC
jgi:hypothetical protein